MMFPPDVAAAAIICHERHGHINVYLAGTASPRSRSHRHGAEHTVPRPRAFSLVWPRCQPARGAAILAQRRGCGAGCSRMRSTTCYEGLAPGYIIIPPEEGQRTWRRTIATEATKSGRAALQTEMLCRQIPLAPRFVNTHF